MVVASMSSSKPRPWLPAALVLALFFSWLGTALAHEHAPDPTCQVCKVVHNASVDLVRRTSAPEPLRVTDQIALPPQTKLLAPDIVVPQGRAPPTA
jgi:hypothetical protein